MADVEEIEEPVRQDEAETGMAPSKAGDPGPKRPA
jgi:hypothetical protein